MTKKLTQKLTSLLKNNTQNEAVLTFLSGQHTLTSTGARQAGIADPRRVINYLRASGFGIEANQIVTREGNRLTQYQLAVKAPVEVAAAPKTKRTAKKQG
jgi:hypothetical protein